MFPHCLLVDLGPPEKSRPRSVPFFSVSPSLGFCVLLRVIFGIPLPPHTEQENYGLSSCLLLPKHFFYACGSPLRWTSESRCLSEIKAVHPPPTSFPLTPPLGRWPSLYSPLRDLVLAASFANSKAHKIHTYMLVTSLTG